MFKTVIWIHDHSIFRDLWILFTYQQISLKCQTFTQTFFKYALCSITHGFAKILKVDLFKAMHASCVCMYELVVRESRWQLLPSNPKLKWNCTGHVDRVGRGELWKSTWQFLTFWKISRISLLKSGSRGVNDFFNFFTN